MVMFPQQPVIEWRPGKEYDAVEAVKFIDNVAEKVVETYDFSQEDLFLTDYRSEGHHLVAEFETDEGLESKRIEESLHKSYSLKDWRDFLDSIGGAFNVEELYSTEVVHGTSSVSAAMANSWNYESKKSPFMLWLVTEEEPEYEEAVPTEFSAGLTIGKHPMEQRTVEEEQDTYANSIRKMAGLQPKMTERVETTKYGIEGNIFIIDRNPSYLNPMMEAEREDIEQLVENLGSDYSLNF